MVCINCRLTSRMISSQLDMKKEKVWRSPKIWACRKSVQKMAPRLHTTVSGHHQAPLSWARFALKSHHETWMLENDSGTKSKYRPWNVAETKESRIVEVKIQSHVDHSLQCNEHRLQWDIATEPDNQSANLQGDPTEYASLNMREEIRQVEGWFDLALWHINYYCLFNAKYISLHINSSISNYSV